MSLRSERQQRQETVDFCLAALDHLAERTKVEKVLELAKFLKEEGVVCEPVGDSLTPLSMKIGKSSVRLYVYVPLPSDGDQHPMWIPYLAPVLNSTAVMVDQARVLLVSSIHRYSLLWKGLTLIPSLFSAWSHLEHGLDGRRDDLKGFIDRVAVEIQLNVVKSIAGDCYQQQLEHIRGLYEASGEQRLNQFFPPTEISSELAKPFQEGGKEEVALGDVQYLLWKLAHFELIAETEPDHEKRIASQVNCLLTARDLMMKQMRNSSPGLS